MQQKIYPRSKDKETVYLKNVINTKDFEKNNVRNDVWVGYEAVILSGVTIGDGAIIGARAVVTKDIPPYTIVGGVPAQSIRKRFSQSAINCRTRAKEKKLMPTIVCQHPKISYCFTRDVYVFRITSAASRQFRIKQINNLDEGLSFTVE